MLLTVHAKVDLKGWEYMLPILTQIVFFRDFTSYFPVTSGESNLGSLNVGIKLGKFL